MIPLRLSEYVAESMDLSGGRSDGVERTEIHHVNSRLTGEIHTGEILIQTGGDGRSEDVGPGLHCQVFDVDFWVFVGVTETVAERIV